MLKLTIPMDGMSTSIKVDDVSGGGKHELPTNGAIGFQRSLNTSMFFEMIQGHTRVASVAVLKIFLLPHTTQLATFTMKNVL